MRKWGLLGLLCLCVITSAQDKTLTITIPGLTVRNAIAKIAEITGEELTVHKSAEINTLVFHLEDYPLDDVLERIAFVTDSYWNKVGDRKILTRRNKITRGEDAHIATIKKAQSRIQNDPSARSRQTIEQLVAEAERLGGRLSLEASNEEVRTAFDFQSKKPATRLAMGIVKHIDPKILASVNSESPVFLSNRPNSIERPLPKGLEAIFKAYVQEQVIWQEEMERSVAAIPVRHPADPRARLKLERGAPEQVFIRLLMHSTRGYIGATIVTADREGWVIDTSTYILRIEHEAPMLEIKESVGFDVYPDVLIFNALLPWRGTYLSKGMPQQVPDEWRQTITKPDEVEPLSYGPGRLLVQTAKVLKRQLVALVPDDALKWQTELQTEIAPIMTSSEVLNLSATQWTMESEMSDALLTMRPRRPNDARSKYLDRGAMAKLLKSQLSDRLLTFNAVAEYVRNQPSPLAFETFERRALYCNATFIGNISDVGLANVGTSPIVKIVGSMSNSESLSAKSEQGIPVSQLGTDLQKKIAQRMLSDWVSLASPIDGTFLLDHMDQLTSRALAKNGLAQTRLMMSSIEEPMLFSKVRSEQGELIIGNYLAYSGNVYKAATEGSDPQQVQLGTRWLIKLRIEMPGGYWTEYEATNATAPPTDNWIAPGNLPQAILERLKSEYERSQKELEKYRRDRVDPPTV